MALTLFPYVGGKSRHAKMVAALCDAIPHTCYIEPFAGAASIFFSKKPVKVNVLNDTNRNITAIFKALREEPLALMQLLYRMEYSEDLFYEAHRALFRDDLTTVQRAAYHLVLLHMMCGRPHVKRVEDLPEKKQKALKRGGGGGMTHGVSGNGANPGDVIGPGCDEMRINGCFTGGSFAHGNEVQSGAQTTRVLGAGTDELKIQGCHNPAFAHGTGGRAGTAPQTVLGTDEMQIKGANSGFAHGVNKVNDGHIKKVIAADEMRITGGGDGFAFTHGTSDRNTNNVEKVIAADEMKITGSMRDGFAHGTENRRRTQTLLGSGTDEMKIHGCHNPAFAHGTSDCRAAAPKQVLGAGTDEMRITGGADGFTAMTYGDKSGQQTTRVLGAGTDETALPPGEISMADLLGVPPEFFGRYWHFINRLRRNVQIMNRDAFDLLKRLDKPGVLFYVDPPYEECRSKESYTGVDHNRLAELLTNMKHAKWIISQYDTELYNERYKDFKKVVKPTRMSAVGGTKHSPEHHKVVEAFWVKQ